MKVVLFCGGQGMRIREVSDTVPKPMVRIGYRPILWHLMKYYAHFGHTEFILCLGHQGDVIKNYFLHYEEAISNDFTLRAGGAQVQMLGTDISDWQITFVDTGRDANIGERLMAVREHLGDDEVFLANYADGLTDAPLPPMIDRLRDTGAVASMILVNPANTFHVVTTDDQGMATEVCAAADCGLGINGGFFVLRREIFDHMEPGDELVAAPFQRLMERRLLTTYKHDGFWACMDTFKEKRLLDDLNDRGSPPWELWKKPVTPARARRA